MANAHHKTKTTQRRDLNGFETVRDAARVKELARSEYADFIEAKMRFEDAETTDGGYQQKPHRPVSQRRSLMGGSLR